jgi:hypothetical protein
LRSRSSASGVSSPASRAALEVASGSSIWIIVMENSLHGEYHETFCNSQAAQNLKIILKSHKKERTSFCEQKEAKKL